MRVSSVSNRIARSVEQLCSPTLSSAPLPQTAPDTAIRVTRWGDRPRVASNKVEANPAQPTSRWSRSSPSFIDREETPL